MIDEKLEAAEGLLRALCVEYKATALPKESSEVTVVALCRPTTICTKNHSCSASPIMKKKNLLILNKRFVH